jgi:hypothetical protein
MEWAWMSLFSQTVMGWMVIEINHITIGLNQQMLEMSVDTSPMMIAFIDYIHVLGTACSPMGLGLSWELEYANCFEQKPILKKHQNLFILGHTWAYTFFSCCEPQSA